MCEYCRKLTQRSYTLREGQDIFLNWNGEAFIDFFNYLTIHIEHVGSEASNEISIPIKYCPWCGEKLEVKKRA